MGTPEQFLTNILKLKLGTPEQFLTNILKLKLGTPEQFLMNIFQTIRATDTSQTTKESTGNEIHDYSNTNLEFLIQENHMGFLKMRFSPKEPLIYKSSGIRFSTFHLFMILLYTPITFSGDN